MFRYGIRLNLPRGPTALVRASSRGHRGRVDRTGTLDRNGMVVLDERTCLQRLGRNGLGRVAVSVGALPAIFPVGYAVDAGDVYFLTGAGTKLGAAARNAIVAFEVDAVDVVGHQ